MHEKIKENSTELAREFSRNTKKGIQKILDICTANNITNPEEQIAALFIEEKATINLERVGQYLGAQENSKVLNAFANKMNFQDKKFIDSLQNYLAAFDLPGEAQQIDRLLEAFATKYSKDNPHSNLANKDFAFIIAFATIMLNTDLHNASVQRRMSPEQFKKSVEDCIKENNDIPQKAVDEKFIDEIYDTIKAKKIDFTHIKEDPGIVLHSTALKVDPAFKAFSKAMQKGGNPKNFIENFPPLAEQKGNYEVTIDKPVKRFIGRFTGYQGTMNIKNKEEGYEVMVQVYKPSVFSRVFSDKESHVIIQPKKSKDSKSDDVLLLCGKIAGSFKVEEANVSISATYDYQKEDLKNTYQQQQEKMKTTNWKDIAAVSKMGESRNK